MAYSKKKEARYIAHLDLARVFDRALRRAQIEVAYSEGFNPHPKIAFGPPLPVGVEGLREYVDIDLKIPESRQQEEGRSFQKQQAFLTEALARLQKQLPEGIELSDYALRPPGSKAIMALVNLAEYRIEVPFLEAVVLRKLKKACQSWLGQEEVRGIRYQKGRKVERNIRPFVKRMEVLALENEQKATMRFEIIMGNAGSVRPGEVLESLRDLEGLPVDISGIYTIRESLYIERDGVLLDPLQILK
jgi:radical SAM-linked protein